MAIFLTIKMIVALAFASVILYLVGGLFSSYR